MRAPFWLRLAWAEIRGGRGFAASFVLNLAIGLVGFLAVDALRAAVTTNLDRRSKSILAADLGISSNVPFTDEEKAKALALLPQGSVAREETGMLSMVAATAAAEPEAGASSRLVALRAIDPAYPFYGAPMLRVGGEMKPGAADVLQKDHIVWVYPEVLAQLGAKVGDELKIGGTRFRIADVVEQDPSIGAVGLAMAPKVFMGRAFLKDTGLVTIGSRVQHQVLYKVPIPADPAEELTLVDDLAKTLRQALPGREMRVTTHRNASEDTNRLLIYLNDYLGLLALVALFLAGIGSLYLFRSFLAKRSRDIAILLSVGAKPSTAVLIHIVQLAILGAMAALFALALTAGVLPLLPKLLGKIAPEGLTPGLTFSSALLAFGMGVLGSILFCLPTLLRIPTIKPSALFQEAALPAPDLSRRQVISWLVIGFVAWRLAVYEAHSVKVGTIFVAGVLGASVVLAALGYGLAALAARAKRFSGFRFRLAALALARRRGATLASFLALSLGALLVTVVPQIRGILTDEFAMASGATPPSLFMFDIQDEQLDGLKNLLKDKRVTLQYASPMIRARLTHVNGNELPKAGEGEADTDTREGQERERMKSRSYNLSYRSALAPSETLVAGTTFAAKPESGLPGISLEVRFAERLGLGLGDKMSFDIQGVAVEGEVQNLRKVRWTSFEPNFFVQFAPGVLEDAPKTHVAIVSGLAREAKIALQTDVVAAFPNVALIDVDAAVARILEVVAQITRTVAFMAIVALLAGIAVLYAIAAHKAREKARDVALLKALGASFGAVRDMLAIEFALLGLAAGTAGTIAGTGVSFVVAQLVFDRSWRFDPVIPIVAAISVTALCVGVGYVAVRRALATHPASLLTAG